MSPISKAKKIALAIEKQALCKASKENKKFRQMIKAKSQADLATRNNEFVPIASQLGDLKSQTHVAFNPMRKTRFVR